MTTKTDKYANLRAVLDAGPTPGEWYWSDAYPTQDGRKTWSLIGGGGFGILSCDGEENSPQSVNTAVAEFIAACDPDTIHSLLAERDALREALEVMVEMVEMNGFGKNYAMDVARAALAQGKEEA